MAPEGRPILPSTWFTWHDYLVKPGMRVLDLACGDGRHSLAAAGRGARVTAWDRDAALLDQGRAQAAARGLEIDWAQVDLEAEWPAAPPFDAVLIFNYLDRERMARVHEAVAPAGLLIMETFLSDPARAGVGPDPRRAPAPAGRTGPAHRPARGPARTRGTRTGGRGTMARGRECRGPPEFRRTLTHEQ